MKKMIKIKKIVSLVLAVVMCSVFCLTVSAVGNSLQEKTDLDIVNKYAVAHGSTAIPEDAKALMKKDGNWDKIVKFVKAQNQNSQSLSYKVQFIDGGCAVLPSKDTGVEIKKVPINNKAQDTSMIVSSPISINSIAYWKTTFNVNILMEVVLSQKTEIEYGNMDIHYWYQTHTAHSFLTWCGSDSYWAYCYGSSPNSISYNEMHFTNIPNGLYTTKIFVNYTGDYNHLYGDTYDVRI